uniref:protein-tyrosine-phosphatase n=1 Tax=Chromera velia CCMP2878 TaxID=1169474 RepID=A0A0G4HY67_9ALVE|eukprot:Cvel_9415.t1-p1 / transcript=Cvel_9415.t1 / gene=Cvel_9415 / organism=Chromera_velia_CCMP2878 / gene_product=Dual specificity protein phosphatase 10, putative / transcript_product=Dual specificity protein phosphatase 10, putative / location=Cvel_scaffold542:7383-8015(+) / protein_length=211 / sequence_SO=supercontig / SO=protein_coding / is_pseudo=false
MTDLAKDAHGDASAGGFPVPFFPESGLQEDRDAISEILPGLFLTNFRGAEDLKRLQALKINHVLCVNGPASDNPHPTELNYMNIVNVEDEESQAAALRAHFENAGKFIHANMGKGVVVHCAGGISRSSSIVLFYLMKYRNMNLREAFAHTMARRRVIWPNTGFMQQLIEFEKSQAGKKGRSTITAKEYQEWTDFSPMAYKAAKTVDRPREK